MIKKLVAFFLGLILLVISVHVFADMATFIDIKARNNSSLPASNTMSITIQNQNIGITDGATPYHLPGTDADGWVTSATSTDSTIAPPFDVDLGASIQGLSNENIVLKSRGETPQGEITIPVTAVLSNHPDEQANGILTVDISNGSVSPQNIPVSNGSDVGCTADVDEAHVTNNGDNYEQVDIRIQCGTNVPVFAFRREIP